MKRENKKKNSKIYLQFILIRRGKLLFTIYVRINVEMHEMKISFSYSLLKNQLDDMRSGL